ncbi:MAG: hypothetical protein JWQ87_5472 [Candidatus Sulfotelmatobacter sp.]|nr:hypothetical protein [Candidatus Sulfotelmatobacter sp.]
MPRANILQLACDFCGLKETFDQSVPQSMSPAKIHKWRQVSCADDPVVQGMDNSRWFDSLDCMVKGEERVDRKFAEDQQQTSLAARIPKRRMAVVPSEAALPPIEEVVGRQDS